jgi:hypothetical protein
VHGTSRHSHVVAVVAPVMHGTEGDKTLGEGGVVDLTSGVIEEMKAAARTAGLRHFEVRCTVICCGEVLLSFAYHFEINSCVCGVCVVVCSCLFVKQFLNCSFRHYTIYNFRFECHCLVHPHAATRSHMLTDFCSPH